MDVPGDDPATSDIDGGAEGDTIEFYINNNLVTYTATWHSGTNAEFDLEIFGNQIPIAQPQEVVLTEIASKEIILVASDGDNDDLNYYIKTFPSNGALSGTPPDLTYTPLPSFTGEDSFTFFVNDGEIDSNIATVSIRLNNTPTLVGANLHTLEDTSLIIDLAVYASDADNDLLSWEIVSTPANGTLSGTGMQLNYTPDLNYPCNNPPYPTPCHEDGEDSFIIRVYDGYVYSDNAQFTITVEEVDDRPVSPDMDTIIVYMNQPKEIRLAAERDPESDIGYWEIVVRPSIGKVTDVYDNRYCNYTPVSDRLYNDSFTYKIVQKSGDLLESVPGTVPIEVIEPPEADYSIFLPLILK